MNKYFVEKFNTSDDSFVVTSINQISGYQIKKGEIIFTIETSKSDIDIESPEDGYIYFKLKKGDILHVSDLFYIISPTPIDFSFENEYNSYQSYEQPKGFSISKRALELMELHDINPNEINKNVIKLNDVEEFINKNSVIFNTELILNFEKDLIPIIIIGAGGGAKMCIDLLRTSNKYKVVGLLDDKIEINKTIFDIPVIGNLSAIDKLLDLSINHFIIAFGVLEKRIKRYDLFKKLSAKGCHFPNIIHDKAIVETSVKMGVGNVVLAGSNIGSSVIMGDLNYINNNSLISHDCVLKNNIHIAPGAVLASSINIQSHVLVGMNTTLYYGINIGESTTILNGLTINTNLEPNIIKKNNT
jgi:sugar O-acyltransferase (sialic acid O-acetyltransferase NeuD family)